jgi:hypothetical protein
MPELARLCISAQTPVPLSPILLSTDTVPGTTIVSGVLTYRRTRGEEGWP